MNFQTYLELVNFINNEKSSQEERRAFGLKNPKLQNDPLRQLLGWFSQNRQKYPLIKSYLHYTHYLSILLAALAFVLGVILSTVLLTYSGNAPVNIIYFLSFAVFLPAIATLLSFFAMRDDTVLTRISFFYLLQKIIEKLFHKESLDQVKIDKKVEERFLLLQLQLAGLLFSVGIFTGLLFLVSTRDIAFAWSTTLNITPQEMASFVSAFSALFHPFCPSTEISLDLIQKSHYFRLGSQIDPAMLHNAASLGFWWKFLACAILFYNIGLRLIAFIISYYRYKKSLTSTLLEKESIKKLLYDFNQPIIQTHAQEHEEKQEQKPKTKQPTTQKSTKTFQRAFGWSLSKEKMLVLSELFNIQYKEAYEVGGALSLDEEEQLIASSRGDIVLFIPTWEIPTMEFIDFLDEIESLCDTLTLYPVGLEADNYRAKEKDLAIWKRKIALQNYTKVTIA